MGQLAVTYLVIAGDIADLLISALGWEVALCDAPRIPILDEDSWQAIGQLENLIPLLGDPILMLRQEDGVGVVLMRCPVSAARRLLNSYPLGDRFGRLVISELGDGFGLVAINDARLRINDAVLLPPGAAFRLGDGIFRLRVVLRRVCSSIAVVIHDRLEVVLELILFGGPFHC